MKLNFMIIIANFRCCSIVASYPNFARSCTWNEHSTEGHDDAYPSLAFYLSFTPEMYHLVQIHRSRAILLFVVLHVSISVEAMFYWILRGACEEQHVI